MRKIHIVAIVAALITAVLVYVFLVNINKPNEIEKSPVIIANYDIQDGQLITKEMLSSVEMPSEAVHPFAARSFSDAVGKVSNGIIVQNEQVISTKLVEPGESEVDLAYALEEGQRAFTVAVTEVSGVAGLLKPKDSVDVLFAITIDTMNAPQGEEGEEPPIKEGSYSYELLQNIKVLAVGKQLEENYSEEETIYTTVTLSVTPEQALQLNLAIESGSIRLVLRSPLNTETKEAEIINIEDLLKETADTNVLGD